MTETRAPTGVLDAAGLLAKALRVVAWNVRLNRRRKLLVATALVEPFVLLLVAHVGINQLVGGVSADSGGGTVSYDRFFAPALVAMTAASGALIEAMHNFFDKWRFRRAYDYILLTPISPTSLVVGEVCWSVCRASLYVLPLLIVLCSVGSFAWSTAIASFGFALLISFCFAGIGTAVTTLMRTWRDFDLATVVVQAMFFFSATYFPIAAYPAVFRWLVDVSPLYLGTSVLRSFPVEVVSARSLLVALYLVGIGLAGTTLAAWRLTRRVLP